MVRLPAPPGDRGLNGVQLIISDACRGRWRAPRTIYQTPMAALHGSFYRNVFSHVPTTKVREVSHMLKAIHAQENRDGR